MLEFLENLNFGKEIKAHGEEWQFLKYLHDGYCIVIKKEAILPCPVYCIKEEEADENETK